MIKIEEHTPAPQVRDTRKKERQGRWSKAEKYLFECLLEKFGKNWARIHEQMPQRSLSQIRSHAQKFFERVGPAKVQHYKRTADLIEAYEILERENIRKLESTSLGALSPQMAKLEPDTSNGEEEKPNEFSSDKSEASEELMRGEGKKVLKNRRQTLEQTEGMVFLPLLGQADFGNARSFVLHIGNHFVPYGLSNVLLENCQAASQTQ